jgi:hypothetical protein
VAPQQAAHPEEDGRGAQALQPGNLERHDVEPERQAEQEDPVADAALDSRLDRVARLASHRIADRRLDPVADHAQRCRLDREAGDRADMVHQTREPRGLDQPSEHRLAGIKGALELGDPADGRGRHPPRSPPSDESDAGLSRAEPRASSRTASRASSSPVSSSLAAATAALMSVRERTMELSRPSVSVGRKDLAGVEGGDRDLQLVDDGQDPPAGECRTDLEVVQATGPAQGDRAPAVGDVVAEAEVAPCAGAGGLGLRGGPVRLGGGHPPGRPVGPVLVVVETEPIELGLELGEVGRRRLPPEPAFEGLVEALDLALGLGWPGAPFFWRMPR